MTLVKGKDVNLYVESAPTVYDLAACATSFGKEEVAEEILVRQNSSRAQEYIGGVLDATLSLDGAMTLDEVTKWQYKDWLDNIGEVIGVLVTYDDSLGNRLSYTCDALITGVSDQSGATDFSTFSITMRRSGAATTGITVEEGRILDSDGEAILDSNGDPITEL